jgi:3-deoxy-7-phosphoheptulonate synthase
MKDLRLVRKQHAEHHSVVALNGHVHIGGPHVVMMAGPCSVESYEQLRSVADTLLRLGIPCLRGGAFKPRTSPYSFQGLGVEGLQLLDRIRQETGLAIISEVMSAEHIEQGEPYLDCFQVGARNMQNFELLKLLGRSQKPILLKRGLSATLEELLYAAEYVMAEGNPNVILCERGIRSFDGMTRNVMDVNAVPVLKDLTHLPVVMDPSHATGKRHLVLPAARAAVAVGSDGVLVEAHPQPDASVSDAEQALSLEQLAQLAHALVPVAHAVGRPITVADTGATVLPLHLHAAKVSLYHHEQHLPQQQRTQSQSSRCGA